MGTNSACNVPRHRSTKDTKVPRCRAGGGSGHEVPAIPDAPRAPAECNARGDSVDTTSSAAAASKFMAKIIAIVA